MRKIIFYFFFIIALLPRSQVGAFHADIYEPRVPAELFEELQDIGVTQGDATEGLVAWVKGLFDSDSPSRDDLLFYQAGGTPSEDNNAFLGIYAYNLEVISSIGTLYPQVTLNIFKDVLLNFVNEVQENLDSAAAVLGAQEDQLTTPFESLPRPTKEALKPVEHQCYLLLISQISLKI